MSVPPGSAYTIIYNQNSESLVAVKKLRAKWFTEGGVTTSIIGGKQLLNNPGQHVYPGGGLGQGKKGLPIEDPRQDADVRRAAIREWQEETGLRIITNGAGVPTYIQFPAGIRAGMTAVGYNVTDIPIVGQSVRKVPSPGMHYGVLNLEISDIRMVDIIEAFRQIELADSAAPISGKLRKDDELATYTALSKLTAEAKFVEENQQAHPHGAGFHKMDTTWFSDMARHIPFPVGHVLTAPELIAEATTVKNPKLLSIIIAHANADATVDAVLLGRPAVVAALKPAHLARMAARADATTGPLIAMRPNANAAIDVALLGQSLAAGALKRVHLARMVARADVTTGPLIAAHPKANAVIDAALLGQPLAAGALTTVDLILMAARADVTTGPLIAECPNGHAIIDAALLRRSAAVVAALTPAHLVRMMARANAVTEPLIGALIAPQAAVPLAVLPPAPVQLHFQTIGGRPPPHPPALAPIARRRNKRPRPPGSGSEK